MLLGFYYRTVECILKHSSKYSDRTGNHSSGGS